MPYRTNSATVADKLGKAIDAGLLAAANVYRNRMVKDLMPGYTTGAFSNKGQGVAGSVAVSEPMTIDDARVVKVGSRHAYALYWELGHLNVFIDGPIMIRPLFNGYPVGPAYARTGPIRRVEKWRPALEEEAPRMQTTFAAVFDQVMHA